MNHTTLIKLFLIIATSYGIYHMTTRKRSIRSYENTLIVGTNAEYRPFSFINKGEIDGFDIDLVKEVAQRLNKQIEIKDMPFTALIPDLQYGNVQMIAAGMSATPERAQQVNFTRPYVTGDSLLAISLKDQPSYANLKDLDSKEIIVNQGFTADMQLSTYQNLNLKRLDTVADAFLALKNGRGDVFISAQCSVDPYFAEHGKAEFNITPIQELSPDNYVIAVSKEFPELLDQVQTALDEITEDKTLEKLKQKWNINGNCNV
jgi:polar amino acid transport system substrate-binding protein